MYNAARYMGVSRRDLQLCKYLIRYGEACNVVCDAYCRLRNTHILPSATLTNIDTVIASVFLVIYRLVVKQQFSAFGRHSVPLLYRFFLAMTSRRIDTDGRLLIMNTLSSRRISQRSFKFTFLSDRNRLVHHRQTRFMLWYFLFLCDFFLFQSRNKITIGEFMLKSFPYKYTSCGNNLCSIGKPV